MKIARIALIFSYGIFSIASQSLIFREFVTTFEGSDISVGIFFGTWFLWVALGALLVYRARTLAEKFLSNIEFLFLGYLPAFILQLILIVQARELAGIESYALWSVRAILLLSIVINAPVSIITGMLFPILCRWFQSDSELPISRVYITEAAGSFVGGLGVTALLGLGVNSMRVFFVLALIVSLSAFFVQFAKRIMQSTRAVIPYVLSFLPGVCVLFGLVVGADEALMRYVRVVKWTKLLPTETLTGSFQTAQAEYLYGLYHDQWIAIREGTVTEAIPDESTSGRIAAIGLCQKPDARRVLVIGSGLGLCRKFLRLSQIEQVTWAHCDSQYVQKVNRFIPAKFRIDDKRFYGLAGDVRSLLEKEKRYYDIVILNLPDATSSVLNRYYSLEFYQQVKESLSSDGVLEVRVAGGENIMGTELVNLGASMKLTLEKTFSRIVLTPGEETWFIASDSESLTGEPATLRDRFARIKGASDIFSPEALLSVYLPDRAASAFESYSGADLPEELLINRDSRPLTHLYSLLLAAKQSGAPITKFVKHLALAGPLAFFIPILVFIALRVIYILKTACQDRISSFDSTFLVFSAGAVAIGIVIVLMYLYQTRFGSLYLYIGVISSVFMVGLTTGATIIRQLLVGGKKTATSKPGPQIILLVIIILHTLILSAIAFWLAEQSSSEVSGHLIFAIAFFVCGLCSGCYFPLAARQLTDFSFETGQAGSKLEMSDHFGASAGGLLTGLILVPVLGTKLTLFVFVLLMLANIPFAVLRLYKPEKVYTLDITAFRFRRLGYILFGIGISVILCSNLLAYTGSVLRPSLPRYAAQALAGELQIKPASTIISESSQKLNYFKVCKLQENEPEKITGYIFSSEDFAPEVRGFGGMMNLAIYVDDSGRLINFHIIRSNETPAYLELLGQWRILLNGRGLFQLGSLAGVDAVTGATVSSKAVLSALQTSGGRFTGEVLGKALGPEIEEEVRRAGYLPDIHGIYLISAFALGLIVIYYGGFWSRLAILCFNLVLGGIVLNAQYSSEQIATLLSLQTPTIGLSGAFILVVGIPILVIIFGNIYCGYICPFGAAQELVGYIFPRRLRQQLPAEKMRKARFTKSAVLFIVLIVFFLSRNRMTLAADPLIEVFARGKLSFWLETLHSNIFSLFASLMVLSALVGSVFFTRFWCRYLCPAGAFLSLLNGLAVLKRYLPAKRFGRCEFGLTPTDQMDCLYCDRCRYEERKSERALMPYAPAKLLSQYFVVGVLVVAVLFSTVSVSRFLQAVPVGFGQTVVSTTAAGQPRDVNLKRIRTMIDQKKLSEQEAEFYEKIE